jgi:hypothetical protein
MRVKGQNRDQATLFPERTDELIAEDNAVRLIADEKRPPQRRWPLGLYTVSLGGVSNQVL